MIVITGAAGFIGSAFTSFLNSEQFFDLVLVDDFSNPTKNLNLEGKKYAQKVDRQKFFHWLDNNHKMVQMIIHLGARTDTTEFDYEVLKVLNLDYTKTIWTKCTQYGLPLIYASSAATYGDGSLGYNDNHEIVGKLQPLNAYGKSKNEFDKWALSQDEKPYYWVGLKFFNVYGPNEYHKGRMASVVMHAFNQIQEKGCMNLFRSHRPDFADGEQKRDFVYVKDLCKVLLFLMNHRQPENNGLYNVGTGHAESFNTLADSIFSALDLKPQINYIDTPEDIRDKYQYFTEANMDKLKRIGYNESFYNLRKGVKDYVQNYLIGKRYY